ncbi:hypothetical protein ACFGVR_10380 [Mucilaginibacter sp. AW1-3]
MKKILFTTFLILVFWDFAKAQIDYCKDIAITDDKTMSYVAYRSPLFDPIAIGARLGRDDSHKSTLLSFLVFNKTANYESAGLYVIFADGTIWKDEGADIHCSYFDIDRGYRFGAVDGIKTEDEYKLFETKKIKSIKVGTLELAISDEFATKFMAYVKCIHDIKK